KPDNVLLGKDGRPRVADFGLARMQQPSGSLGTNDVTAKYRAMNQLASSSPELNSLTQTGMLMGTPLYMSPEQHMGEPADSRSDQFSFCVALYEALYKQLPYEGSTLQALALNTVKGKIRPRPTGSNVPAPVHEALLRGLSKTPDQRFPSMRELLAALAFDPAKDLVAAPQIRRALAVVVPGFFVLEFLAQKLLRLEGVNEVSSSLALSGALSFLIVLLMVRLRRVIKGNAFHRGMLVLALGFTGQLFCFRVIGVLMGLSLPQITTFDLISVLVMTGVAATLFLPKLGILTPLAAAAALWAARHPEHAQSLSLGFVPTATVTAMLLWNSAAKLRIPTNKEKAPPPETAAAR
ncbi:MAG TPA: protein kinase, partial [Pseudomonadota bacterium]|nr:protein kinase [Pseudomonadota bacterium]